jgi:hypothetical protein
MRHSRSGFYSFIILVGLLLLMPGIVQPARSQHVPTWNTTKRDLLGESLGTLGWTRDDLGFRPKGYWARYPNVPYKLPFFDSLFSEPMRVYDYTRTMGNAVEKYLDPEYKPTRMDGLKTPDRMHQLIYFLAIERRVGGFRSYSTNLLPRADEESPILDAIRQVYISAGDQLLRTSFGAPPTWPNAETDISDQLSGVAVEFQKPIAECILNAIDARVWRDTAVRNVTGAQMTQIYGIRDFAQTQGDGIVYYGVVDDIARVFDEQSMAYAAMKLAQATEDCRYALEAYIVEHPLAAHFKFETMTPYGHITIGGKGKDTYKNDDYFVLIDLGGDDTYLGPVGASTRPDIGVGLCLDLNGNDKYEYDSVTCPSQGAGVLGVGVLYDAKGNDIYKAKQLAQGAGFFGTGVLFDGDGTDEYVLESSGQGAGFFGHGLCFDSGTGDDNYKLNGEGQGFGGCSGVGILADWSGNDHYYAEPSSKVVNRGDYHSGFDINVSNAQGVGSGRRGDGTDGHSWAGGLGLIADIHGNDIYEAGNFSLGTGYWFGTGLMYDKEGNDLYKSVYFTQASGAHYCIGAIIDESGNDTHELWSTSGAGLSFGWDFTISLLVDKSGDDTYKAYRISGASSDIRSNSFFFDLAGNDNYIFGEDNCVGCVDFQSYDKPHPLSPFYEYCNSIGLFIDAGGEDIYTKWIKTTVGEGDDAKEVDSFEPSTKFSNNAKWEQPPKDDKNYGYNNFGIGWDVEVNLSTATIPDITWLDPPPALPEEKKP